MLARMAKRRMPHIVRQRNRLHQVLIKRQGLSDRARNLGNF